MRMTRLAVSLATVGATLLLAGAASAQSRPSARHRPHTATTPPRPPSIPVRAAQTDAPLGSVAAPAGSSAAPGSPSEYEIVYESGRPVYRCRTIEPIVGTIQRPYPFSIVSRAPLGYQYQDEPVHFVQHVVDVTRAAPY